MEINRKIMTVKHLFSYPVKSLVGNEVKEIFAEKRGFRNDRRWMFVDAENRFVTARDFPFLLRIGVQEDESRLVFRFAGNGRTVIQPFETIPEKIRVTIWRSETTAHRLADDRVSTYISRLAGQPLRLVYMAGDDIRPVSPKYGNPGDIVSFADGYPVLVVNTASLADLNQRLKERVEIGRFRPNLVVDGEVPWVEDGWKKIKAGNAVLRIVKPCARCVVTTIDPASGRAGNEPLQTLSLFRRQGNKVLFGINATVEKEGVIAKADKIEVLE